MADPLDKSLPSPTTADPLDLEKAKAMANFNKFHRLRIFFLYSLLYLSIFALICHSFSRFSPSTMLRNTKFWFVVSNIIVLIIAVDSGVFSPTKKPTTDLYDEFLKNSASRNRVSVIEPICVTDINVPEVHHEVLSEKLSENTPQSPRKDRGYVPSTSETSVAFVPEPSYMIYKKDPEVNREISSENLPENLKKASGYLRSKSEKAVASVAKPIPVTHRNDPEVCGEVVSENLPEYPTKESEYVRSKSENGVTVERKKRKSRRSETMRGDRDLNCKFAMMSVEELNRRADEFISSFKLQNMRSMD